MHLSVLGHWQHSTEKFIIRNSSARIVDSKNSNFFRGLLQLNQCHFGRHHNSLTIFDLMVRDRATVPAAQINNFIKMIQTKKLFWHFLALWMPPGGNFFRPFERPLTVDDFCKSALCRYVHSFMLKMAFDSVID